MLRQCVRYLDMTCERGGTSKWRHTGRYRLPVTMMCLGMISLLIVVAADQAKAAGDYELCQLSEKKKILALDAIAEAYFGYSIQTSDDVLVVGAPGDPANGTDAGAAYVYRYVDTGWIQEQKLIPQDGEPEDLFGYSVAVDGDLIVVGNWADSTFGDDSGSAYVFRFDGSTWVEEQKLLPEEGGAVDDYFGYTVAVSNDFILIGKPFGDELGPGSGSAYVFHYDGENWIQQTKLLAWEPTWADFFGSAVALQGNIAMIGAEQDDTIATAAGAVYIFRFDGSVWLPEQKILPIGGGSYGRFGDDIDISGHTAVIGTYFGAAAYAYQFNGSSWIQEKRFLSPEPEMGDYFGSEVTVYNDVLVIGAPYLNDPQVNAGAAYLYRRNDAEWPLIARIQPSDIAARDAFAFALDISGETLAAGSINDKDHGEYTGSIYMFSIVLDDLDFDLVVDICDNCPNHANPDQADCDDDGIGDVCAIDEGLSEDCQLNGVPDECDIAFGTSTDLNGNGIPDECECIHDLNGDDQVNIDDIFAVLGLWGDCPDPCPPYCNGDLTEDCTVNIDDIFAILGMWGPCE